MEYLPCVTVHHQKLYPPKKAQPILVEDMGIAPKNWLQVANSVLKSKSLGEYLHPVV